MNSSYNIEQRLHAGPAIATFNMHELTFVNQGSRALYIVNLPLIVDMTGYFNGSTTDSGWILDLGICEVNTASGETTFIWWACGPIALSESSAVFQNYKGRAAGWDWL